MVYYFVIGTDGNRYGPVDVDTLCQWAREGRVIDATVLLERGTDRQVRAGSMTAIAAAIAQAGRSSPGVAVERDPPRPDPLQRGKPTFDETLPAGPPPITLRSLPDQRSRVGPKSKVAAGVLGILLGGFGAHRFYLGYSGTGVVMLLLSLVLGGGGGVMCGMPFIGCGVVALWGFIEGIMCLTGGFRDADGRELRD